MTVPLTFSIVVPTYRRPDRLAACVESLAALDYPRERFQIIVVDDGSGNPPNPNWRASEVTSGSRWWCDRTAGPPLPETRAPPMPKATTSRSPMTTACPTEGGSEP